MKIIYGIAGEGNGHVMRSKEILDFLKKEGHEVMVFSHGKGYKYLKSKGTVNRMVGFHIYYFNNRALGLGTGLINLLRSPFMLLYNLKYFATFLRFKPDVVISDFEPWTNYFAYLTGKPLISLENQSMINHSSYHVPVKQWFNKLASQLIVTLFVPFAKKRICPLFYTPKHVPKRFKIVPSLLQKEIIPWKKKVKIGKHVFVYQTSPSNRKMFDLLKKRSETYIVYGFNKEKTDGNIIYRKFNDKKFYEDLANARAVICNGGLMLMTEALYLGKSIYSIPVEKQFEQFLNAYFLEEEGLGVMSKHFEQEIFEKLLKDTKKYTKNIEKVVFDKNEKLFKELRIALDEVTQK